MPYAALTAGAGYFIGQTSLDSALVTAAQEFADTRVNEVLWAWDRTAWTGSGIPLQVKQAAEKIATGHYLEKVFAIGNPEGTEKKLAQKLLDEGEALLQAIIDAGGPIDPTTPTERLDPLYDPVGRRLRVLPG